MVPMERTTHIGRLLLELSRDFIATANERIRDAGFPFVSASHIPVLAQVEEEGSELSTVISRVGASKQAVNKTIRQLEANGILELAVSERDFRARVVTFTPKGRTFLKTALRAVRDVERLYAKALGEEEFAALKGGLAKLAERRGVFPSKGSAPEVE
jgi:DNA-binding MarR family transcriptional regulator